MQLNEIRQRYLDFFKKNGHQELPSASLVPENDPTTLFTGSGMQPLVPYLLGKEHPKGSRLVDSQKCFRSMDIEEVGDNRHTTFFEMLGNWSLGDYFKEEQLRWFFTFLTDEIGLDPSKLYVTAFLGDKENNIPKDTESGELWKKLFAEKNIDAIAVEIGSEEDGYTKGMKLQDGTQARIFYYDASKNWWSRAGVPKNMPEGEPGGPDSEMFYDFGTEHDTKWGKHCHPNCDCGRFLEIGNSVFMQYIKKQGKFEKLPKQNVDFGGGLERIAAAKIENPDVFQTDAFKEVIKCIERATEKQYSDSENHKSFRVIADHLKAAIFLICDGVEPGNKDQSYFVRRLLRRSILFLNKLKSETSIETFTKPIIEVYKDAYPELVENKDYIDRIITLEEKKFTDTLLRGQPIFEKMVNSTFKSYSGHHLSEIDRRKILEKAPNEVFAEDVFELVSTYGYPLELVEEMLAERKIVYDKQEFRSLFEKRKRAHQDLSRAGSEQKFKGGLADASLQTTRLHTAHHLLLKALQMVLGEHVHQRGSNITAERLRIDFSHPEKMTDEQKSEVERIVNEKIKENLPVLQHTLPKEEAEKLGAEHEFNAKYPDMVSVYEVGPNDATLETPHFDQAFSLEFCGGPHVERTGELGTFKLGKEEASSAGVRRLKATLENESK